MTAASCMFAFQDWTAAPVLSLVFAWVTAVLALLVAPIMLAVAVKRRHYERWLWMIGCAQALFFVSFASYRVWIAVWYQIGSPMWMIDHVVFHVFRLGVVLGLAATLFSLFVAGKSRT